MSGTIFVRMDEIVDTSNSGMELIALLLLQFIDSEVFKKDNKLKFFLEELETSAEMGGGILNFSKFDMQQFREAAKVVLKAKEYLENLPIPERNAWFESHGFIGAAYDNESPRCIKKILEQLAEKLVEDPRWNESN